MDIFSHLDETQLFMRLVDYRASKNFNQYQSMSLSTLWRKIDLIEDKFKTKLFYRQAKGALELTKDGLKLYNLLFLSSRKVSHNIEPGDEKPTIFALTPIHIANLFSKQQILSSLDNDYNVRYLTYTSLTNKINSVVLDNNILLNLAISCDVVFKLHKTDEYFSHSNWKKVITLTSQSRLYATKKYFESHPKINLLSDLIDHKYIMNKSGSDQLTLYSDNNRHKAIDVPIHPYLTSDNEQIRQEMAKKNLGVTHLPETMISGKNTELFVRILPEFYTEPVSYTHLTLPTTPYV